MDTNNRCGNCGHYFTEGDAYCIKCGTRRGVGHYTPLDDFHRMPLVYGPPPILHTHRCKVCGHESRKLRDENYCAKCGGETLLLLKIDSPWR